MNVGRLEKKTRWGLMEEFAVRDFLGSREVMECGILLVSRDFPEFKNFEDFLIEDDSEKWISLKFPSFRFT
jgi:hypothetical protein